MVFHVPDHRLLAGNIPVPFLEGGVNGGLGVGRRNRRLWHRQCRVGFFQHPTVQLVMEVRIVVVELHKLQIPGGIHRAFDGGVSFHPGIFPVGIAAGVLVCLIRQNGVPDQRLVGCKHLLDGGRWRFGFWKSIPGLGHGNAAESGVFLFQLGILRLLLLGQVIASGNQLAQPLLQRRPLDGGGFPVMVPGEFQPFAGVIRRTGGSVQKGMAVSIVGTIFFFQKSNGGLGVRLVLVQGIHPQLPVLIAGSLPQLRINIRLGNRKSGGLPALRFVNVLYLLCFRKEQV